MRKENIEEATFSEEKIKEKVETKEKKKDKGKDNHTRNTIIISIVTFFLGIAACYGLIYAFPAVLTKSVTKVVKDVTITDTGIAESVDKVYDSVVVVSTYKDSTLYASGSGFIYKVDGDKSYIITNNHVIESGNNYKVSYTDGEEVTATLLGGDEYSDIAVLEVKTRDNYNAVTIGKTEDLSAGDTVFTVGAPLDETYSWTVTRGIISGKERLVEISLSNNSSQSDYIMNVIQTDAAVNSGNSGGPLSNANGEVVGVISAKISSTGVEGMGFAIPIETAIEKAEQFISGDSTSYPYLGVSMLNVSDLQYYQRYYGNLQTDLTSGVYIMDVESDSAADKAGIKSGDVIVKINDTEISNVAYLRYELYKHSPGDKISITINRDGKEKTVSVKLTSSSKSV